MERIVIQVLIGENRARGGREIFGEDHHLKAMPALADKFLQNVRSLTFCCPPAVWIGNREIDALSLHDLLY